MIPKPRFLVQSLRPRRFCVVEVRQSCSIPHLSPRRTVQPLSPSLAFHRSLATSCRRSSPNSLQSSFTATALLVGVAAAAFSFFAWETATAVLDGEDDSDFTKDPTTYAEMPYSNKAEDTIPTSRPGNLTAEEDAKLRELWYKMGELIGLDVERFSLDFGSRADVDDGASVAPSSTKKKSRFGRFGRGKEKTDSNDKHGSNKEFQKAINDMTHEELRAALWDFSKCDDPDANLCRYLRARKWVVQDALVMLVSTIYWRQRVMHLDDEVMINGEEAAVRATRGETTGTGGLSKQLAQDMLDQLRLGKSFVHGVDKVGRPLCFVRVKLHHGGEFSAESLERLTVYMIETARFLLDPPKLETAVLIFDMSGFSMANMDHTPLKFMIKVFEANYPESLGAVLVHNAPWIFQSVWGLIKGWLDPVVASKINFTKDTADMAKFIDMENIPRDMGGDEDWEYEYPEPIDGENAKMSDTATRTRLEAERKELLDQFETATMEWVVQNGVNDGEHRARRKRISKALYDNYWQLDPYVRARSMYDRLGVIGPGGVITSYPTERPNWASEGVWGENGKPATGAPVPPVYSNGVSTDYPAERSAALPSAPPQQVTPQTPSSKPNGLGVPNWHPPALKDSDSHSVKSGKSVYYDAQSELD